MRDLLHPRDSEGIPRHFAGHSEAFLWVAGSLARYGPRLVAGYSYAIVGWLVWNVGQTVFAGAPLNLFPPEAILLAVVAVAFPLMFWVLGSVLVYAYLVLSGIVAGRVGREQARRRGRKPGEVSVKRDYSD